MDKISNSDLIFNKIVDIEEKYYDGMYGDYLPLIVAANILATLDVKDEQARGAAVGFKSVIETYNHLATLVDQNELIAYHPLTRLPISEVKRTDRINDVLIDLDTLLDPDDINVWYVNAYGKQLDIKEPSRKNDWYYCILDHAIHFKRRFNVPPSESQLWAMMYSESLESWSIQVDDRNGLIKLGGKSLDRETFKKRFRDYFPSNNGE